MQKDRLSDFNSITMKRIFLETISLDELITIIKDIVSQEFKNYLPRQPPPDEFLTRKEAAELLKISLPTLHKYSLQGIIKKYKMNNQVRYRKSDIGEAMREIRNNKFLKYK